MPFAPTDIANCTLWLKSTLGTTQDANGRVSRWANAADTRENLISYSSALDTAGSWGDSARVNLTFPSSDIMQAAATNVAGTHTIFRYNSPWNMPVVAGWAYVIDFSLKANGVRYVQIQTNTDFATNIKLDLLTGTVSSGTATVAADGDYWRVSVPFTAAASANNPALIYLTGDSSYTLSWTGDNTVGIFMKKPQLRNAAASSSYVASTAIPYGNHFYQATDANKPLLSRSDNQENLVSASGDLGNSVYWTQTDWPVAYANNTITASATANSHGLIVASSARVTIINGNTYRVITEIGYNNYRWAQVVARTSGGAEVHLAVIDLENGQLGTLTGCTATISTVSAGRYRVTVEFTKGTTAATFAVGVAFGTAGNETSTPSWTPAGTEKINIYSVALQSSAADSTYLANPLATAQYRGVNGLPTLVFDGAASKLDSTATIASIYSAASKTAFVVFKPNATNVAGHILNTATASMSSIYQSADGNIYAVNNDGAADVTNGAANTAGVNIYQYVHDTGKIYAAINSNTLSAGVNSGNTSDTSYALGLGYRRYDASNWYSGRILELITFNRALTAAERQQVTDYLGNQWGVNTLIGSTMLTMGCGSL